MLKKKRQGKPQLEPVQGGKLRKTCLYPSFTNMKNRKELFDYVEGVMQSYPYSYDSDTNEENTVFEESGPK